MLLYSDLFKVILGIRVGFRGMEREQCGQKLKLLRGHWMWLSQDCSGLLVKFIKLPVACFVAIHWAKVAWLRLFSCLLLEGRATIVVLESESSLFEYGLDGWGLQVGLLLELPVPNTDSLITTAKQRCKWTTAVKQKKRIWLTRKRPGEKINGWQRDARSGHPAEILRKTVSRRERQIKCRGPNLAP